MDETPTLVEAYRTLDKAQAHLLKMWLEQEGIHVSLFDDLSPGLLDGATLPVRLMVPSRESQTAQRIIQEYLKKTGG